MPHGYQIRNQEAAHFLTLVVVQWADIFTRKAYRDIVIESLDYCQKKKGLEIFAFVIMSNHIHLLVSANDGNLSNIIRDFKRHTSKTIIEAIQNSEERRKDWLLMIFRYATRNHNRNNEFQLWTHDNHPIEVFSNKFIEQKINYIHQNPVKASIVENPEDYLYSSARNYADLESPLSITKASLRWKNL